MVLNIGFISAQICCESVFILEYYAKNYFTDRRYRELI